jgi:hypothetical protein
VPYNVRTGERNTQAKLAGIKKKLHSFENNNNNNNNNSKFAQCLFENDHSGKINDTKEYFHFSKQGAYIDSTEKCKKGGDKLNGKYTISSKDIFETRLER